MNLYKLSSLCTVLSLLIIAGCDRDAPKTGASTVTEMEQTETNQERLAKAIPPPSMTDSLERRNLVKHLERQNQPDKIGYFYMISYGKIMGYYLVKGKVSSLESYLTTPQQIISVSRDNNGTRPYDHVILPSPDFDGSYGKNPEGVFFFTPDDKEIQYRGDFIYADAPLNLTDKPAFVYNVDRTGR